MLALHVCCDSRTCLVSVPANYNQMKPRRSALSATSTMSSFDDSLSATSTLDTAFPTVKAPTPALLLRKYLHHETRSTLPAAFAATIPHTTPLKAI